MRDPIYVPRYVDCLIHTNYLLGKGVERKADGIWRYEWCDVRVEGGAVPRDGYYLRSVLRLGLYEYSIWAWRKSRERLIPDRETHSCVLSTKISLGAFYFKILDHRTTVGTDL